MKNYFSEDEVKIIDSKIGKGCNLYHHSEITSSKLSPKCTIGNFSRIRHSILGDLVRIDRNNFVLNTKIGDCTYTGNGDVIMHAEIGKFCSISWGCTIGPGEHDYNRLTTHDFLYNDFYNIRPKNEKLPYNRFEKKMNIGNDVWIGCGVTILRGCKIGNGAVIGANSLVNFDVPPYSIVAGVPAKIIKYRFSDDTILNLEELKWWDIPLDIMRAHYKLFLETDINEVINKLSELKTN